MTEWGQNLGGARGRWCKWLSCFFLKIICLDTALEQQPAAEVLPALVGLVHPAQLPHMYSTMQLLLTDISILTTCWLASPLCTLQQARAVKKGFARWRIICNKYSQRTREPDILFNTYLNSLKEKMFLEKSCQNQLNLVHLYLKWKVDEHTSLRISSISEKEN